MEVRKRRGTDEIIKQDGGMYSFDSLLKSVRQQTQVHA